MLQVDGLKREERREIQELLASPERDLAFFLELMRNKEVNGLAAGRVVDLMHRLQATGLALLVVLGLILWRVW